MKKRVSKKAEGFLGMGFGMIFSIFLIVIFLIVAIYAITKFLDYKNCSQVGLFIKNFQDEITVAFNKQQSSFPFEAALPTNIKYVCFANFSKAMKGSYSDIGMKLQSFDNRYNMFFYPREKSCIATKGITHLNLDLIIKDSNPYCIPASRGRIEIQILKGFNDGLVRIA
ncbi:hypothetical protein J4218_01455 [Candidatus Pacearchaeota archaeon]|nr:hypothetical protein [Candidatus Pacearchaeota archaeon]